MTRPTILADGVPVTGLELDRVSPRTILPGEWDDDERRRRFGWEPSPVVDSFDENYERWVQREWSD